MIDPNLTSCGAQSTPSVSVGTSPMRKAETDAALDLLIDRIRAASPDKDAA